MSTIGSVNPAAELAKTLIQRYDANKDGALNNDEFAAFLSGLLGGVKGTTPAGSSATASAVAAAPPATTLPTGASTARVRAGALAGFDEGKLSNESHQTFKYQIGRILQYYPATPEGLRQALPEIQQLVPGATLVGTHGDKIDFGDYIDAKSGRIGVVDVLVGAAIGGRHWAWQPEE